MTDRDQRSTLLNSSDKIWSYVPNPLSVINGHRWLHVVTADQKLVGLGTYDHNLSELVKSVESWSRSVMNGHRWSQVVTCSQKRLKPVRFCM